MTLATADEAGVPWASPVWFSHRSYADVVWVSRPGARHSRNIAVRPQVGIVIFDSTVPIGGARAVYLEAVARPVGGQRVEEWLSVFSDRLVAHGESHWGIDRVTADAPLRLYVATISTAYVLDAHDQRVAVDLTRPKIGVSAWRAAGCGAASTERRARVPRRPRSTR